MFNSLKENYRKRKIQDEIKEENKSKNSSSLNSNSNRNNNSKILPIIFHCREGSVTHYFHFFYGAMIPLIEYSLNPLNSDKVYHIVSDIGPFKRTLLELPLTIVSFETPDLSIDNISHDDKSLRKYETTNGIILPAYDSFGSDFYHDSFLRSKLNLTTMRSVFNYFEQTIPPYIKLFPTYDIVIIQRGSDNYYEQGCSNRQELFRTSGETRRSITNHHEMVERLKELYPNKVLNIVLERSSIYFQYHLFNSAKVIIAQHGASLANIFFMQNNPNGSIIEIITPWGKLGNHFKNLAEFFSINYYCVEQQNEHDDVNFHNICEIVNRIFPHENVTQNHQEINQECNEESNN